MGLSGAVSRWVAPPIASPSPPPRWRSWRPVSRHLAEGLRRALLLTAPAAERHDHAESAGVVLLAADNSITLADSMAESWLAELGATGPDAPLPPVVTAVASRARSSALRGAGEAARSRAHGSGHRRPPG